jgi:hypothetical protein
MTHGVSFLQFGAGILGNVRAANRAELPRRGVSRLGA